MDDYAGFIVNLVEKILLLITSCQIIRLSRESSDYEFDFIEIALYRYI